MSHYEWDDVKTKGFGTLLYKLYLGLTYPLRHPFVTVVVLLSFYRHELNDLWIKHQNALPEPVQQATLIKKQTTAKIEEKLTELRTSLGDIVRNINPPANQQAPKDDEVRFVSWNVAEFNKVKYEPLNKSNAKLELASPQDSKTSSPETTPTTAELAQTKSLPATDSENISLSSTTDNISGYYTKNNNLHLEYLPTPEQIFGQAEITGANSLIINGRFMFLYGIYTDPDFYSEELAAAYLRELTSNQIVNCEIVAETYNKTATALCFVNGRFINKLLVNEKMARNVALQ